MANIPLQVPALRGTALEFTPASADGDAARTAPSITLLLRNDSAEARVATIRTAPTDEGLEVLDVAVGIPANSIAAVPMAHAFADRSTNATVVTVDNPEGVALALIQRS